MLTQLKPIVLPGPLPNEKTDAPSTKNGRRSSKNVSKAERFTTAGSTST
jgi:hypothetical protein